MLWLLYHLSWQTFHEVKKLDHSGKTSSQKEVILIKGMQVEPVQLFIMWTNKFTSAYSRCSSLALLAYQIQKKYVSSDFKKDITNFTK